MDLKSFLKSKDSEYTPYPIVLVVHIKIIPKIYLLLIPNQTIN
ncbi:hypothetical protein [Companilactobacillus zhachilii]|nr:hypothetical protein [Companilactobacillus zhachilii]